VQHYGYKYDYAARFIDHNHCLGAMPSWLEALCDKLCNDKIFSIKPDQIIINEYMPGQGIAPHIDRISCFSDTIASLSLLSQCEMDFTDNTAHHAIMLYPRSLLILKNQARYIWHHGIKHRKSDGRMARTRRISLTFRKVVV
jgi:alkylated DNA repair dioxygenase AlkB